MSPLSHNNDRLLDARSLLARLLDDLDEHRAPSWIKREVEDVKMILDEMQGFRTVYCKACNKTHAARPDEEPCAPGAWADA